MALNNMGLGFVFEGKDVSAGRVIRGLSGDFGKLDRGVDRSAGKLDTGLRRLGITAIGAGAALGAVKATFAVAGAGDEFEQGIAAVGAVTKATRAEVDLLTQSAIKAGIATQFDPAEATQGLLSLATAGQTATDATKTLIPVLDLAAGSLGQLGVAEAAESVVGTLNSYQISVDKAGDVTDKLLRVTQLTNFQTRDFSTGLSKAASAGATFGQSLDDTLILMGLLRNANIDASSSSTAVREAFRKLGSDRRAQRTLRSIGVSAFDAAGRARPVIDVMRDLDRRTAAFTDKRRQNLVAKIFGARGLLAFNAVSKATFTTLDNGTKTVLKGEQAISRLRKEMTRSGGTAQQFREKLLDTFKGQKTLLAGTVQTLGVVVSRPLAQVLRPVVSAITGALNAMIRGFLSLPEPVQRAIVGFGALTAVMVGLLGTFIAVRGAAILLGPAIRTSLAALGPLLIPLLKVALVLGAVIILFAALKKAFDANFGGFRDEVNAFRAELAPAFAELKSAALELGKAFLAAVRPLLPVLRVVARVAIKALIIAVKILGFAFRILAKIIKFVVKIITVSLRAAAPVFRVLAKIVRALGRVFVRVGSVIKRVWIAVGDVVGPIIRFISEAIDKLIGLIKTAIRGLKTVVSFVGKVALGPVGALNKDVSAAVKRDAELKRRSRVATGETLERLAAPISPPSTPGRKIEITVNTQIDGNTVAKKVNEINLDDASRRTQ